MINSSILVQIFLGFLEVFLKLSQITIGWFAYVGIPMSNDSTHIGNITEKRERWFTCIYTEEALTQVSVCLYFFLSLCSFTHEKSRTLQLLFFLNFFRFNFTRWAKSSCYVQFGCFYFCSAFFFFFFLSGDGRVLRGKGLALRKTRRQSERRRPMYHVHLLPERELGCDGRRWAFTNISWWLGGPSSWHRTSFRQNHLLLVRQEKPTWSSTRPSNALCNHALVFRCKWAGNGSAKLSTWM